MKTQNPITLDQVHELTPKQFEDLLNNEDWSEYDRNVNDKVAAEVDAYRLARIKSKESAAHKFLL